MKKVLLLFVVFVFAVACNKGGGGGGKGGSPVAPEATASGVVIHSSFSAGDIVFFDRNGNRAWDNGEPSAAINSDGSYAISGTAADLSSVPLVALLGGGAQPAAQPMAATDELIFEAPAGQRTISSLTTTMMDSDPMLSLDEAHAEVQSELGTSVDLFGSSSAALADKVTTVMQAMIAVLDGFGISLSDKALMLIMSEITPQLSDIAAGGAVDDNFGNATANDINNEMNTIAANAPSVITGNASGYQFHNDSSQLHDGTYQFDYIIFEGANVKLFRTGTAYTNSLPDQNATYKETFDDLVVTSITKIPLNSKTLIANPRHIGSVTFSAGAEMYKVAVPDDFVLPSLDSLIGCTNALEGGTCEPITFGNVMTFERDGTNFKLTMNNDGTYKISFADAVNGNTREPFAPAQTLPSGKYEPMGSDYVFKDIDGKPIFYIFNNGGHYIAGRTHTMGTEAIVLFNATAAQDIQSDW